MRAQWEGLHTSLVRSVSNLPADQQFRAAGTYEPALARFESSTGLVEYLTGTDGDLNEKDRIYAALVRAIQARARWSAVAHAVAWLGLWPGLDGVYRRCLKHFCGEEDDLVSSISSAFTRLLGQMDLAHVERVAATIVRSTEREVMEERRRKWKETSQHHQVVREARSQSSKAPGSMTGHSFEDEVRLLRERLLPIIGADTDLLLAVVILGDNHREAGKRMGLPHGIARKRIWRALGRLRNFLRTDLSQFEGSARVSVGETAERPGGVD